MAKNDCYGQMNKLKVEYQFYTNDTNYVSIQGILTEGKNAQYTWPPH